MWCWVSLNSFKRVEVLALIWSFWCEWEWGHGISMVFAWNKTVISGKFSVLIGCLCPGLLTINIRLLLGLFFVLFLPIGLSKFPVISLANLEYVWVKKKARETHHGVTPQVLASQIACFLTSTFQSLLMFVSHIMSRVLVVLSEKGRKECVYSISPKAKVLAMDFYVQPLLN